MKLDPSSSHRALALGLTLLLPLGCDSTTEASDGAEVDADAEGEGADAGELPAAGECAMSSVDGAPLPTGIPQLDGFFEAITTLQHLTTQISGQAETALMGLGTELGAPLTSSGSPAELAGSITETIDGLLGGTTGEGMGLMFGTVDCLVDALSLDHAIATCEGSEAADADAMCDGSCIGEGGTDMACDATLLCEGFVAGASCAGECTGACAGQLVAGSCDGTCTGLCAVTGLAPILDFSGACDGLCTGSCELSMPLGGSCDAACTGECLWESTGTSCGAAVPECLADEGGSVACGGACNGVLAVPGVSPECVASVGALVNAAVECALPAVVVDPSFVEGFDSAVQGELLAMAHGITPAMSSLLATAGEAQHVLDSAFAAGGLLDAIAGLDALAQELAATDPTALADLACVLEQLAAAQETLLDIQSTLQTIVHASMIIEGSTAASSP